MSKRPVFNAILAALCYGISIPIAKMLLGSMHPVFMAALLYIGAGTGMAVVNIFQQKHTREKEARITKRELPYVLAMIGLDIAAPILLMIGLSMTSPATASLLNNFEIVATTVIALVIFKEAIGKRMWFAILLILIASVILTVDDYNNLSFSLGSVLVLLACICWGIENNCTRMLSLKNPLQIVVVKGIGSGLGALIISISINSISIDILNISIAILLGFVSYGLSIYFYILAQRNLGASRTSAFYAFAPFIGVGLSFVIFRESPAFSFWIAVVIMLAGAYLAAFEKHKHEHTHIENEHEHRHNHEDGHHDHKHSTSVSGEHSHLHKHTGTTHIHTHTPDMHHTHEH